ncbi:MAG: VTT domain-containing protein [Desulfobacterales bacterium]
MPKKQDKKSLWLGAAALAVLIALAAAWQLTALSEWISVENMNYWARKISGNPFLPLIALAAYVIGGFVVIPITFLIGVTALVFEPILGGVIAMAGSLLNAVATYWVGILLGNKTVQRMTGDRIEKLRRLSANQGILTVAAIRNLPVAPYSIVNVIAGAMRLDFKSFFLGTLIGLAPGITAAMILADRLVTAIKNPGLKNIGAFFGLLIVAVLLLRWLRDRMTRESSEG